MLMLGPVLERLEDELLDPLIDRTFAVMLRAGLLPEAPDELRGEDLKVEYISVLAQAQQAISTVGIERLAGFVGNLAGVNPGVLDKIDFDQAIDEYGHAIGTPPTLIRSDEQVAEMRAQRAQAEQAQQAMAMAQQGAQGAKLLSETDMGGQSALDAIVGGMTGGA